MSASNRWGSPAPVFGSIEWMDEAACLGSGADFFPVMGTKKETPAMRKAKAVCATCPVKSECLAYALDAQQWDGIWGGMTPTERRELSRARLAG